VIPPSDPRAKPQKLAEPRQCGTLRDLAGSNADASSGVADSRLAWTRHGGNMRTWTIGLCLAVSLLVAAPAWAFDVFLNGIRITNLKNADLQNCSVKFDADGNIHIISAGYNVTTDKDGNPRVSGSSDMAGAPQGQAGQMKSRYVLVYTPNPKVNFAFELYVNGKMFKRIGLDQGAFTVEMTQDLHAGNNVLRVVARPSEPPPGGTETDIATLRILKGNETAEGTFVAKKPAVWELVRAAIDTNALDRTYNVVTE
jgi:hypothetical protein